MPELSRFYGIIIVIVCLDKHSLPHIHAYYGGKGDEAEYGVSISIQDHRLLAGHMPAKPLSLIVAWMNIHQHELVVAWDAAKNGRRPGRIAPLR